MRLCEGLLIFVIKRFTMHKPLYIPTLAERGEDIPLLIDHFLIEQAKKENVEPIRFSTDALEYMKSLPWPGNVRQLQNVIEHCCVLSPSPLIPASLVKQALSESENKFQTLAQARQEFNRYYLNRVLRMVRGLCIVNLLLTNINKPSQSLIINLKFNDFLDIR